MEIVGTDTPGTMRRTPASPLVRRLVLLGLLRATGFVLVGPELFAGNRKLYDAIEAGDGARVRTLLARGADPNSRSYGVMSEPGPLPVPSVRYHSPPLLFAIERRQPEIALILLQSGADPDAAHARDGRTPLIAAAEAGLAELVRLLLERGADATAADRAGNTPLHHAPAAALGNVAFPKDHLDPEVRAILQRAGAR